GRGLALHGRAYGCGGWSGTLLITVAGSDSLQAGYSAGSAPLRSAPGASRQIRGVRVLPVLKKVRTQPDKTVICREEDAPRTPAHLAEGRQQEKKNKNNKIMMLKQHLLFVLCSVCGTVVKGESSRMPRLLPAAVKGVGCGCVCANTHSYSSAILGTFST
ncbi:cell adhesion molecule 2b isoform X3, partial [Tachysurus ichikawai]